MAAEWESVKQSRVKARIGQIGQQHCTLNLSEIDLIVHCTMCKMQGTAYSTVEYRQSIRAKQMSATVCAWRDEGFLLIGSKQGQTLMGSRHLRVEIGLKEE